MSPIGELFAKALVDVLSGHAVWEVNFLGLRDDGTLFRKGFAIAGIPPPRRGNPLSDSWKRTLRLKISDGAKVGAGAIPFERHRNLLKQNAWIVDGTGPNDLLTYRLFSAEASAGEMTARLLQVLVLALELDVERFFVVTSQDYYARGVAGLERYMDLPLFGVTTAVNALTDATRGAGGITLQELYDLL